MLIESIIERNVMTIDENSSALEAAEQMTRETLIKSTLNVDSIYHAVFFGVHP